MYYTQKNHIQKKFSVFTYKNLLCSAHTKITIHFYYVFFPYKKLLCILTHKNCHTKNVSVFLHTQKYYVIHKKLLVFLPYKIAIHFSHTKITMYSHTQNCHTKMLVFFYTHKKIM